LPAVLVSAFLADVADGLDRDWVADAIAWVALPKSLRAFCATLQPESSSKPTPNACLKGRLFFIACPSRHAPIRQTAAGGPGCSKEPRMPI
jgi:hypothetical protein